jgi:LmbE family N-acetylglucosaminyl deacetylase
MREKPLVLMVTDSWIQWNRGDGITAEQRRNETIAATKILGCPVFFAGLRDDTLSEEKLRLLFKDFKNFDKVYAPAIHENGNPHHNMIGKVAKEFFDVTAYTSYSRTNLWINGKTEIDPTPKEVEIKNEALDCYISQINLPSTSSHFSAVRGRSEFYE